MKSFLAIAAAFFAAGVPLSAVAQEAVAAPAAVPAAAAPAVAAPAAAAPAVAPDALPQPASAPYKRFRAPLRAALPAVIGSSTSPSKNKHTAAQQQQPAAAAVQSAATPADSTVPLLRNFEVTVPPLVDPEKEDLHKCSVVLSQHVFGNSYGQPNVFPYSPSLLPDECQDPSEWVSIVLRQHGTSFGRQFDRLGSIWIGNAQDNYGLELWRTDNPEPRKTGVVWDTRKDVSKYWPALSKDGSTMVYDYPNIVDDTYTGSLNMTLSMYVYVPKKTSAKDAAAAHKAAHKRGSHAVAHTSHKKSSASHGHKHRFLKDVTPDVLIPLSTRQQNAGSLFAFGGGSVNDTTSPSSSGITTVSNFPRNALSALVEVYASGTANEEFWYTSVPDKIFNKIPAAEQANLGLFPRGPFREVQVLVDDMLAGIALPYATIFTGGINPLMWRPQSSFGAYDQKTYTLDLTPFVPLLADGNSHDVRLRVVSAERNGTIDASWFLSGNIQVRVDPHSTEPTTGKITKHEAYPATLPAGAFKTTGAVKGDLTTNGTLTAVVQTKKPRTLSIEATVVRPGGRKHAISIEQAYDYYNHDFSNAASQVINQTASGHSTSKHDGAVFLSSKYDFPLRVSLVEDATSFNTSVDHKYDVDLRLDAHKAQKFWLPPKAVEVAHQVAHGDDTIDAASGSITGGVGRTREEYSYADARGYSFVRFNAVANNTVTQDAVGGSLAPYAAKVYSAGEHPAAAKHDAKGKAADKKKANKTN